MNNGNGTFAARVPYAATGGGGPQNVVVADFNKDGWLDAAWPERNNQTIRIMLNDGDGTFTMQAAVATSYTAPKRIVAGDFNHDGNPDLAVGVEDWGAGFASLDVFTGDGAGGMTFVANYMTGADSVPFGLKVADLNRDGHLDVAMQTSSDFVIHVYLGTGTGTFAAAVTYTTASWALGMDIGDMNHDGIPDLIAVSSHNGAPHFISLLFGVGNGTFGAYQGYTMPAFLAGAVVADFNTDGNLDVATPSYSNNNIAIVLGDGSSSAVTALTPSATYATNGSGSPYDASTADFNRDGKLDLMSATAAGNTACVWLGN
jgi:hypothetical protein